MKKDHFGFALFLVSLLIAPEVPMQVPRISAQASVSLGFVGLLGWALLCPFHVVKVVRPKALAIPSALVLFAFYVLAASVNSGKVVPIGYAGQYIFYVLFGFLMLSGYWTRALQSNQLDVSFKIFRTIGLIYALGVVISKWTGPIYPHMYSDIQMWHTYELDPHRAVGFGGSPNNVGSVLLVFTAFALFLPPREALLKRWLFFAIFFFALLLTMSRSALLSFFLALFALMSFKSINVSIRKETADRFVVVFWLILCIGTFLAVIASFFLPRDVEVATFSPFMDKFNFGGESGMAHAVGGRTRSWLRGLHLWSSRGFSELLWGRGFQESKTFATTGWVEAHNAYIDMLGDFGVIGLALFLLPFVLLVARSVFKVILVKQTALENFTFVAVGGMLIQNLSGPFYYSPVIISLALMVIVLSSLGLFHVQSTPRFS